MGLFARIADSMLTSIRRLFASETSRAVLRGIGLGVILSAAFAGGFFYRDLIAKPPPSALSFDLLKEADGLLAQNYVRPMPDDATRIHGAIKGLVASLDDPYTFYVEPQNAEVDSTSLAGKFGGIGVEISRDTSGQFVVSRVYVDNPAAQAGLQEGDIIVAVDGQQVDSTAPDDTALLAAIRGDVGSQVTITVKRKDQSLDFKMNRVEVQIPSAFWKLADGDKRIGYIQIVRFTGRTPDEVKRALTELKGQGASAYILDLRGNGGGLVDSAVGVASQFLNGGPILYEHSRNAPDRAFNGATDGLAHDAPLVVLVDGNTASAAEIVGGALRDRKRAELIGQKTYGKGSVQLILPMSDGSSLHVTTAEWLTPDHHPLQGVGLTPEVVTTPVQGKDIDIETGIAELQKTIGAPK